MGMGACLCIRFDHNYKIINAYIKHNKYQPGMLPWHQLSKIVSGIIANS